MGATQGRELAVPARERAERRALRASAIRERLAQVVSVAILVLGSIWALVPIYWTFITSLRPPASVRRLEVEFFPANPTLANYSLAVDPRVLGFMLNSLIVAVGTVLVGLFVAALAGYAAARFDFPGKGLMLSVLLLTVMLPGIVIIIPLYLQMAALRLLDTYWVLILLLLAWVTPFTVWLMKGFFESIPAELDRAALVDGYTQFGAFFRVVVPLARGGLAAGAVYVFIQAWNSFLYPLIFTNSERVRTLPLFIYTFLGFYDIDWGRLTAAAIIAAAPVVIMFLLAQRSFIEGLIKGSLKG